MKTEEFRNRENSQMWEAEKTRPNTQISDVSRKRIEIMPSNTFRKMTQMLF